MLKVTGLMFCFIKSLIDRMKLIWFFILLLITLIACTENQKVPSVERSTYASLDTANYYVGIESCASCHQEQFEGFSHTGMGLSYEDAHKGKSLIPLSDTLKVFDTEKNFRYDIFWREDDLYSLEYRLKDKDTVHQLLVKVDDVIGSGQHTNSHIQVRNGYAYQMPFTFYVQNSLIGLPPGFDKGANSRFFRQIDIECMSCHNSFPDHEKGSINKFRNIPNGINCERCHGPGGFHVEEKKKGKIIDIASKVDYSIVNPAKLELDLQFSVCQRCHLQGNTVLEEGKSFYDFVPGMKLEDVMTVYLPRYEGDSSSFIMASHVDRMQMSECFVQSKEVESKDSLYPTMGQMTCITCHNPHQSVKELSFKTYDIACQSCHEEKKCSVNEVDNCASCHMPKSSAIDIPHVSITDHYIRKPTKQKTSNKTKFKGLFAVNKTNPSNRSRLQAYINQFDKFDSDPILLDSAYSISEELTFKRENIPTLVHLYYTSNDLKSMMSLLRDKKVQDVLNSYNQASHENYEAWTLFRVGDMLNQAGFGAQAEKYWIKANKLAPFILEFKNKLASLRYQKGNIEQAKKDWIYIVEQDSMDFKALSNLSYYYLSQKNITESHVYIERAVKYNPDYLRAWENYFLLAETERDTDLMKKCLIEIVRLDPNNDQAKQYLNSLK